MVLATWCSWPCPFLGPFGIGVRIVFVPWSIRQHGDSHIVPRKKVNPETPCLISTHILLDIHGLFLVRPRNINLFAIANDDIALRVGQPVAVLLPFDDGSQT